MQIIPPQPSNYIPLLLTLPLVLATTPAIHIFLVAVLILIRPNVTENYFLISVILLLHNIYIASIVIFEYTSSSLLEMHQDVYFDWRVWTYITQATILIIWIEYCLKKYKQFKLEIIL